jgi:hypothetical protein
VLVMSEAALRAALLDRPIAGACCHARWRLRSAEFS